MYHISANLAFGRRENFFWGYKKLQGGKKLIRKTEKKVATFFFFFFFILETVKNLWGAAKMSRGHQMVTLRHCFHIKLVSFKNIGAFAQISANSILLITQPIFIQFLLNFIYVFKRLVATSEHPKAWF